MQSLYVPILLGLIAGIVFILTQLVRGAGKKPREPGLPPEHPHIGGGLHRYYSLIFSDPADAYYPRTFVRLDAGEDAAGIAWNGSAALCSVFWLLFRGMKLTAAALILLQLITMALAPAPVTLALFLVYMAGLGLFGNRYFHLLVRRDILELLEQNLPDENIRDILTDRWQGGLSASDLGALALLLVAGLFIHLRDDPRVTHVIQTVVPEPATGPAATPRPTAPLRVHLDDLKNLVSRNIHRDSIAFHLMEALNAESSERQRYYLVYLDQAAAQKNPQAQHVLGLVHLRGQAGRSRDIATALSWFKSSAVQGQSDSLVELLKLRHSRARDADSVAETGLWLLQAANTGGLITPDPIILLSPDTWVEADRDASGMAALISRANTGDAVAGALLTEKVATTRQASRQQGLLLELLTDAALDKPYSQHLLGLAYQRGYLGLPRNPRLASAWYRQAASHDHIAAHIQLAKLYHAGDSGLRDGAEALYWLTRAETRGSAIAEVLVRQLTLQTERAYPRDATLARLIDKAGNGDAQAQSTLRDTVLAARDPGQADALVTELLEAAMAENALAQYWMGHIHQHGRLGLKPSMELAMAWYHQAALNGHAEAQSQLGDLYGAADGALGNPDAARYWRLQASRRASLNRTTSTNPRARVSAP